MASLQIISAQENYLENIEEFPGFTIAGVRKANGIMPKILDEDQSDETDGYLHIVDEYEFVDKFKHLPGASETHSKDLLEL